MGAAPSRETHRRGLFSVHLPATDGPSSSSKKQEIVLIPLTKEFFPSPDCPLFLQFHRARCDAAVNYYFRQPGNPGDLSRIPSYAHSYLGSTERGGPEPSTKTAEAPGTHRLDSFAGDSRADGLSSAGAGESGVDDSYPSREVLYRGVIEGVEATLFDTDAEMREAHRWFQAHPHARQGPEGRPARRVLPALCAVAFRYDLNKALATHITSTNATYQAAVENGVYMFGSIINIVGCFGFAPIPEAAEMASRVASPSVPRGGGTPYGGHLPSHAGPRTPAGSAEAPPTTGPAAVLKASGGGGGGLLLLPLPAAAPLAAMVFLTKSAGEQNLGRVTHIAASTYYFQLLQAGVLQRAAPGRTELVSPVGSAPLPHSTAWTHAANGPARHVPLYASSLSSLPSFASTSGSGGGGFPPGAGASPPVMVGLPDLALPPMETFSFSSLLTNIPILSFVHEMRCRWGYLGVLRSDAPPTTEGPGEGEACIPPSPLSAATSASEAWGMRPPGPADGGRNPADEMEMWITNDGMLHGRISKDLAERLCWSMAERPEIMQERVAPLPTEETGYWRYRGLVDRLHPPPLPSPHAPVTIHHKDVYIMASDVLPGFDEGDILCFDPVRQVWLADHTIPLEGVALAAMRSHCKLAREAPPDDPGWVTKLVRGSSPTAQRADGEGGEEYALPPPTPAQAAALEADGELRLAHECVGNFYVHRFLRDGVAYYHGTVPNFANPNKRRGAPSLGGAASSSIRTPNTFLTPQGSFGFPAVSSPAEGSADGPSTSSRAKRSFPVAIPKSISSALFSLLPAAVGGREQVLLEAPTGESDGPDSPPGKESAWGVAASAQSYLASRVTSAAIDTARRIMQNLYGYAYGMPTQPPVKVHPMGHVELRAPGGEDVGGVLAHGLPRGSPRGPVREVRRVALTRVFPPTGVPVRGDSGPSSWAPTSPLGSRASGSALHSPSGTILDGPPAAPPAPPPAVRHPEASGVSPSRPVVRVLSRCGSLLYLEEGPVAHAEVSTVAAPHQVFRHKSAKRYVDGESYVWDWRTP